MSTLSVAKSGTQSARTALSNKVIAMYRQICREVPRIITVYELPLTATEVRHMVGLHFRGNISLKDPRVVEMMLIKVREGAPCDAADHALPAARTLHPPVWCRPWQRLAAPVTVRSRSCAVTHARRLRHCSTRSVGQCRACTAVAAVAAGKSGATRISTAGGLCAHRVSLLPLRQPTFCRPAPACCCTTGYCKALYCWRRTAAVVAMTGP